MTKRLCDLVDLVENNKECVVLAVKESTTPLDLIKLGGFSGNETMFRMSKDPSTIGVTVFHNDGHSYTLNVGSSNTVVSGDLRQVRSQIMECVNLDFGIFTHGGRGAFSQSVEATLGDRDPNSPKNYELQRGGDRYSLFVNDQHIVVTSPSDFEPWLEERGLVLQIGSTRTSGLCPVEFGKMMKMDDARSIGFIDKEVVYPGKSGQASIFKDERAFENQKGICYIPEHGFNLATKTADGGYVLSECDTYTYDQIVHICDGNREAAERVFSGLGWQYPEAMYLQLKEYYVPETSPTETNRFAETIDQVFDKFLGKTGWQGMDTPSAVAEFVRFAKTEMQPSLSDLMREAKEKAAEKNASRSLRQNNKETKTPELGH